MSGTLDVSRRGNPRTLWAVFRRGELRGAFVRHADAERLAGLDPARAGIRIVPYVLRGAPRVRGAS